MHHFLFRTYNVHFQFSLVVLFDLIVPTMAFPSNVWRDVYQTERNGAERSMYTDWGCIVNFTGVKKSRTRHSEKQNKPQDMYMIGY